MSPDQLGDRVVALVDGASAQVSFGQLTVALTAPCPAGVTRKVYVWAFTCVTDATVPLVTAMPPAVNPVTGSENVTV